MLEVQCRKRSFREPREYAFLKNNPLMTASEDIVWFAMSATFGRELKARDFLDKNGVECFIPMKYQMLVDKKQGKVRKLVPAISNLLFVHTTKERIQTLKSSVDYLQYLTMPIAGKNVPIIVPEYQMQPFIAVCETHDERLVYLSPDEINLEKGTPVRIVGSSFDGVEGTFIKMEGKRKHHVAVLVPGIAAVVIVDISHGCLKVLE